MGATGVKAESGCHLVKYQHRAATVREISDPFYEIRRRLAAAHRLHHDGGEPFAICRDDGFDLFKLVEVERVHQPGQPARHALGIEAGQQMTVECAGLAEIGAEIPVVPTVISAERHQIAVGCGARDPDRDCHGFAASSSKAHHVGPRMKLDQ